MSFSEKTIKTLEFDKICAMLETCTHTEGAASLARALRPTDDPVVVRRRLQRTTDARRLADAKGAPSFGRIKDISAACERAEKGAVLSMRELLDVAAVLRTTRILVDYHTGNHPFDTVLDELFDRLLPDRKLEERITRAIPAEDMIADEASPLLADIRRKIRNENAKIKETLQKLISGHAKYLQENIVTMRGGRYVIPVKAECKAEVKGLIHDTSATGATIFIEPMAVVDANNEIRMLQTKEEREIERILAELSSLVAASADAIWLNYKNINDLAFIFACGELSSRMDGVAPRISEDRRVSLIKARHPLIDKDKVVPITLSLGDTYDTLVITGPNTGGKTVSLKTIGLFALMTQAGLHIPCDPQSVICLYDTILVDLGDEQSIEQSLSTFSSHMVNIVSIVEQVGDRSLVLFDELGGGTDPVEGAALAIAVIESVRESGACCVATTHYAELKAYALDTPGVCNASCEFDVETLKPTYKLVIGAPGKSNAFAISAKLGLPEHIIRRAEILVSAENKNFEKVIEQLENSRVQMEKERAEAERLRREYEAFKLESEREIKKKLAGAEQEAEKLRKRAAGMVQSAKASCDYLYEQMEKMRKAQESAKAAEELEKARRAVRDHLRTTGDLFDPVEVPEEDNSGYVLPRPLQKGDKVRLVNIHKEGIVTDLPKNGLVAVQAGVIRTKARLEDIRLIEDEPKAKAPKTERKQQSSVSVERSTVCKDEIDLRGMMGDEAWFEVDKYFDECILSNIRVVRLIHGKGTGALRAAMHRYLKGDKRVASFRLGRYGEGDGGVTIVELK
ncbi:MAG: endonuclease MutS2 [Clostridia bacterium]|nr:endonuclease MutS2 [Clostridia bacterium]MBQ7316386.1 endonuclease MutS2 [Clostridia bacterium]